VPSNGGTELVIVESHLGEAKAVGGTEHKLSSAVGVTSVPAGLLHVAGPTGSRSPCYQGWNVMVGTRGARYLAPSRNRLRTREAVL
jgi:hypothetical protein